MPKSRIHAFISGRVQGVSFRSSTRRVAKNLGVRGWVRNLSDGRVEVIAEGEKDKLKKLIEFLHKGPLLAKVNEVELEKENYKDEFNDFVVKF